MTARQQIGLHRRQPRSGIGLGGEGPVGRDLFAEVPVALGELCEAPEHVEIRLYRVIYEAVEDIRAAMEGMLEPERREVVAGTAEVRETFKVPRVGVVAGANRDAALALVGAAFTNIYVTQPVLPALETEFGADTVTVARSVSRVLPYKLTTSSPVCRSRPSSTAIMS